MEDDQRTSVVNDRFTVDELARCRVLYTALFMNERHANDIFKSALSGDSCPNFSCGKSRRLCNGERPSGGGFIAWVDLPTGTVANWFEDRYWDWFRVPEHDTAPDCDLPVETRLDVLEEYLMGGASGRVDAGMIDRMVERVDARFAPLCRYDGFDSFEGIYRIGENGYVTEREWDRVFYLEPAWAENAYLLVGNGWSSERIVTELDCDYAKLKKAVDRMFNDGVTDHDVFRTEADEDGEA